jgi:hypothetical protein
MERILPVITLYQPWATWIMRGWKTIETRTHNRFKSLEGKRILIHASKSTDANAIDNPYLTKEQLFYNPDEIVNGFILGSALVSDFRLLNSNAAQRALIECDTKRFGLFLEKIDRFETPIRENGEMGIWYFDLDKKQKVKKQATDNSIKLF